MESLTQALPPVLKAFETFAEYFSDTSSIGKASISGFLTTLMPLINDPIASKMLMRAYLLALQAGNILFFCDQARKGRLAYLLVDIQTCIQQNGEDIAQEERSLNERLLYLSTESSDPAIDGAVRRSQLSSVYNGISNLL